MNLGLVIVLLLMLHVVMKFNLGQDSEARFGQDFEAQVLWRGWCLVEILKLMLGWDSADEIWSRFMFQLVMWTQPSGPLCLWQCFLNFSNRSSWIDSRAGPDLFWHSNFWQHWKGPETQVWCADKSHWGNDGTFDRILHHKWCGGCFLHPEILYVI